MLYPYVHVQALGPTRMRFPHFLENEHMKVAKLSALRTGRLYTSRETPPSYVY